MKQLTSEELKKLTAAWQEWTDAPRSDSQKRSRQRLHLVFLLIRYGALRLSEALALNDLKDLDYSTCTIRITGVREREVQVPDRAMQKIRDIVNAPYMFGLRGVITHLDQGYVRKKFYAFSTVCGLDKALVGPQVIRHSRGRELLHNNIPLNIVQKFLGQRSPVQAAGFISFSDEDARRIVHNHLRQETLKRTSARNAFTGTITRVVTGTVSVMVELTTLGNLKVHTLITVESAQRLGIREGMLISATIKAPYVMLAREGGIADRTNCFTGKISGINRGDVESSAVVDISDGTALCSILPTEELDELGLSEGDQASVLFSPFSAVLTLPEE